MIKQITTCLIVLLLMTGALVSGLPIYATTEGGDSGGNESSSGGNGGEGGGSSDEETESESETPTEEPVAEAPPEETNEPVTGEGGDADTCMGGQPGTDGCPPVTTTEPEPKAEAPTAQCNETTQIVDPDDPTKCKNLPKECMEPDGTTPKDCNVDLRNKPSTIHPCLLNPANPACPKPDPVTGDCPEGYAQNEDGNCFLLHPEGCPSGYHGHEDDETGRCIPNSTPCDPGYTFNEGHTNCERPHFTCDGKPSVVECDKDKDNNGNHNNKDHDKKVIIVKKIIKNIDIINKINDADSGNGDDLDISQTIVAINYNEGAGINCVFDEDDNGQCETFDVNKDSGKEPLLQIIDFSS